MGKPRFRYSTSTPILYLLPPSNMRESKYELRYTQTNYDMLKLQTNMGQRSFSYQGAKIWNNLKTEVKTATSLQSFKKLL